jgi:hypothetical protein
MITKRNNQVSADEVEKISAFLSGLKPDLQMFMEDIYTPPRSLSEAYQQAQEASEILYAEGSTSEDEDECVTECEVCSDSDDSEAVDFSDFVSEEESESESCVDSDYIESMDSESEEDECDACIKCGGPLCEESMDVPRRFKCYGCHGTGHLMRDCPLKDVRC